MSKADYKSQKRSSGNNDCYLGVIFYDKGTACIRPCEKSMPCFRLTDDKNIRHNDMVEFEPINGKRIPYARIIKNYGAFSLGLLNELLVTIKYKIPHIFDYSLPQTFSSFEQSSRLDLTALPFVTIDGEDAKDFDDAVWAKIDNDKISLIVAIADVSFYVKNGTSADTEAYRRGNSVYLPQCVIPMLPEKLSNDLCSLRPRQRRPVIACLMEFDHQGTMLEYRFERAVIKSVARLTYEEVEKALGGQYNATTERLHSTVILPLYQAFQALNISRSQRMPLELETDEIKIKFASNGDIAGLEKQKRLTSHRIIEEFMIAANVATARFLSQAKIPVIYRIHDKPDEERLQELKPLLQQLKIKIPTYAGIKPQFFNKILDTARAKNWGHNIDNLILRLQAQAEYSPHNCGHFGLALKQYVHFTSPIRRYADLLIHRMIALVSGWEQDLPCLSDRQLEQIGEHLCFCERNATSAERDIKSRYISQYMQPLCGSEFELKISAISNAGLFVRLEELGIEGLMPMRSLPRDYYQLLDCGNCLRGVENKLKFKLGDVVSARLVEAEPISGGLIFAYLGSNQQSLPLGHKRRKKCSKR